MGEAERGKVKKWDKKDYEVGKVEGQSVTFYHRFCISGPLMAAPCQEFQFPNPLSRKQWLNSIFCRMKRKTSAEWKFNINPNGEDPHKMTFEHCGDSN